MSLAGRLWLALLWSLAALPRPACAASPRPAACAPVVRATLRLPERVDGLLALDGGGTVLALAARPGARTGDRLHDELLLLSAGGRVRTIVALPPYHTLPGLVLGTGQRPRIAVVVDGAMLLLDPASGRTQARWPLDLQAVGWPAAFAAGANGVLYVAGQPQDAVTWTAVVEALRPERMVRPRVLWRARLGLTHAGLWLGEAGMGRLAVYLPDAHDLSGSIALLDERSGAQQGAYSVPVPPAGADPARDRLYLFQDGVIRAVTLGGGRAVAAAPGTGPLAVDARRGLMAYVRQNAVVLASSLGLRDMGSVVLPGVTALALAGEGRLLVAAGQRGLVWIGLRSCHAG